MAKIHLQAITCIESNDWQTEHQLIQTCDNPLACRIHGFLYQEEGDMSNAMYWYRHAGEDSSQKDLDTVFQQLKKLATL